MASVRVRPAKQAVLVHVALYQPRAAYKLLGAVQMTCFSLTMLKLKRFLKLSATPMSLSLCVYVWAAGCDYTLQCAKQGVFALAHVHFLAS